MRLAGHRGCSRHRRYSMSAGKPAGFALIAAVMILGVLAVLGGFMVNLSTAQHQTAMLGVQSARAFRMAQSGLEWAAYQMLVAGQDCSTINDQSLSLEGFTVLLDCAQSAHDENGVVMNVLRITASASFASYGRPDYVFRQVQLTLVQ